jgi:hypothetical protein
MGSVTQLIVQLINRLKSGGGGGGHRSYGGSGGRSYGGSRGGYGRSPRPQMSPEQMAEKAAQSYAFKEGLKEDYGDIADYSKLSFPGIGDNSANLMALPDQLWGGGNPASVLKGLTAPPKR